MADQTGVSAFPKKSGTLYIAGAALLIVPVWLWPDHAVPAAGFALSGLIEVSPLVIPGILLTAWIIASGADTRIAWVFEGRLGSSVLAASAIGAITPVCGVTILPLMAGLLAAGVPLAPIMAFWLSSPITDPAMLATTAAALGPAFAIGKTLAAFGLGVFGGAATVLFSSKDWSKNVLRTSSLVRHMNVTCCGGSRPFQPRIWRDRNLMRSFRRQALATARLILICLFPAFVAEYALNAALTPDYLAAYLGEDRWWAIPAAVLVGAPAYIDGYAALPLTRALLENGMSAGTGLAFLVSGGVVSIWGALAILPVLKLKPFLLYLCLAITGSLAAGYLFEWAV